MELSDYIGQIISVAIPALDASTIQQVKLLGVESGGIWIESQKLVNMGLRSYALATSETSLAFFFPYHKIRFAHISIDGLALDEKAFGV
jgi:hypothetical protein